ncbi:monovalent cation/H(+) antiporter subunit G [uncultured Fretibacterium sp.]|uniref:cation:proton antiporter n=1 Tax=uncultured Fretibacterium sp. TaxID=1678694 RepID=UPI00262159BE|nr:monovalent cation/H(+) antiporter subunit G [uncultured Fretibacterium sp.]
MIRLVIAAVLILGGLFVLGIATLGIFRFESVLNRIHVAAKCDTLGALLVLVGLTVLSGPGAFSLKLTLVIAFLWLANPVASHLVARAEVATNERIGETCDILDLDDIDGLDPPTVPQVEPTSRRPLEERRSRA